MATIYKEFEVNAPPEFVWEAIKDVGAVHTRLARGFVTNTVLTGAIRTVTFANGFTVREQIIAIDDEHRRCAYSSVGGRASHHNAYFQVMAGTGGRSRLLWVTDLLPDDVSAPIAQMVELGAAAIQQTLEQAYRDAK
jgi:carbon monoxide dehydrogenase subunit G